MPDNKRIDVSKLVRLMTLQDWAVLVDAFDKWPFAPKVRASASSIFIVSYTLSGSIIRGWIDVES